MGPYAAATVQDLICSPTPPRILVLALGSRVDWIARCSCVLLEPRGASRRGRGEVADFRVEPLPLGVSARSRLQAVGSCRPQSERGLQCSGEASQGGSAIPGSG